MSQPPQILVLGIESSCDETAAAIVQFRPGELPHGGRILSNIIASQHDLHAEYRGVVPEIASRAHAERILPTIRAALAAAGISLDQLSSVAVGNRPGLIGSLLVGVSAAKAIAWSRGIPLVGVDHVHAHLYAGILDSTPPRFPALGLVVSGGHTSLYRLESPIQLRRIGATIDDALGEAYDKAAAILGLPFPGGPRVDHLAQQGNPRAVDLPISRLGPDSLDFSFSGLKTALLYALKGVPTDPRRPPKENPPPVPPADERRIADLAASFQRAAVNAVLLKLSRAFDRHPECRTLLTGGGVTANSLLRASLTEFASANQLELRLPPLSLCLDNAAMIAGLGHHLLVARHNASDPLTLAALPTTAA